MSNCFECGNLADHEHHVVPRSLGGTKTVSLCGSCHGKVHGLNLTHHGVLTRIGHARNRLKNQRIGNIPYGFRLASDGEHLEENENEQAIISRIQELASGLSYAKISRALAAEGLFNRAGKPFARQAIHLLLTEQE